MMTELEFLIALALAFTTGVLLAFVIVNFAFLNESDIAPKKEEFKDDLEPQCKKARIKAKKATTKKRKRRS